MTTKNTSHSLHFNKGLLAQLTLAGAAALAGSSANAQIVYTAVNENIGFASGDLSGFTTNLPSNQNFLINRQLIPMTLNPASSTRVLQISATYTAFINNADHIKHGSYNGNGDVVAISPYGQTFNANPGSVSVFGRFAGVSPNSSKFYYNTFTDAYFDFEFVDNGQTDYGYIEASLTDNTYAGQTLDIIGYAYDTSGAPVPAGAMPMTTPVPEPSAGVALAALSALTLGAAGVRRMKALKAAA